MFTYINRVIIITYSFEFIDEGRIVVFRIKSGMESVQIITKFFSIGTRYIREGFRLCLVSCDCLQTIPSRLVLNFLLKSSPLVYVCNFVCTAVSPCQGFSVIFSVVNDLYDIYIYIYILPPCDKFLFQFFG